MGWTIITDTGLQIWADDIFPTEAEARAFVAENPRTEGGSRQLAVPTHIARRAMAEYKRILREQERVIDAARREAVAALFTERW